MALVGSMIPYPPGTDKQACKNTKRTRGVSVILLQGRRFKNGCWFKDASTHFWIVSHAQQSANSQALTASRGDINELGSCEELDGAIKDP